MSWIYEQSTGRLRSPEGSVEGVGYSGGDCGQYPAGVNNPSAENLVNKGPIPSGTYEVGEMQVWHPMLGQYVLPLIPDPETRAKIIGYGRNPDTFYCHGDSLTNPGKQAASDGCMVQALLVRKMLGSSTDRVLEVIPNPVPEMDSA